MKTDGISTILLEHITVKEKAMYIGFYIILLFLPIFLNAMNISDLEKKILMEKQSQIMNFIDDGYKTNSYCTGYSQSYGAGYSLYNYEERTLNEQAGCANNMIITYSEQYNDAQTAYYAPIEYKECGNCAEVMYHQLPVNEQQYNAIDCQNNKIEADQQRMTYQQLNGCFEYNESHDHTTNDPVVEDSQYVSKDELIEVKKNYRSSYASKAEVNKGIYYLQAGEWMCKKCLEIRRGTRKEIVLHMAIVHERCYQCEPMRKFKSREEIRAHSFKHHPGTTVTMKTVHDKRQLKTRAYIKGSDQSIIGINMNNDAAIQDSSQVNTCN